jgi:pyrroline-5-carboxylate reductase
MVFNDLLEFLKNKQLGFFGCGHLAKCFLQKIIDEGFPKEKILVSHGTSSKTKEFLEQLNVKIVSNEKLCTKSKLILYFVRPQDYQIIKGLPVESGTVLLSFLAGITIEKTQQVFPGEVIRSILSSPVTINSNLGLVAIYPETEMVKELFYGFKQYFLQKEEDLNAFIAIGTCIPNINVFLGRLITEDEIKDLKEVIPVSINELLDWAAKATPKDLDEQGRKDYLTKAATKGGINEAIIIALKEGKSVKSALLRGLERNQELNKK